jgi:2-polyprenyl-6-methoxyphenol hydroxylase-like FAD-dependent oxidoreductase
VTDDRVLIVGAGIAGLTLARALHRRGIEAEIVERADAPPRTGTGMYLPANGVHALDHLGLAAPLIPKGAINRRRRFLTAEGRTLFEIDLVDFWGPDRPSLGVRHTDLHDVLLAGAAGVPIRRGVTVDVLKPNADGVRVVFDDGTAGRFALVVGADGLRSSVRGMLGEGPTVTPNDVASASWRFVTTCPDSVDCWTLLGGAGSLFLMVPIGGGRAYCFAGVNARGKVVDRPDHGRLLAMFEDYADPVPEVLATLEGPEQLYHSLLEDLSVPTWGRGRAVLVGDAAHAMLPSMAQGAALATEDAIVLADLLAERRDWSDAAERLGARRGERVSWVMEHTNRQTRMLTLPYALRKAVMRLAGEKVWKRSFSPLREPVWRV